MNDSIPYKDILCRERKMFRTFKPYWTQELTELWKEMVKSRKAFEKFKGDKRSQNILRTCYKDKRSLFDKRLRQAERKYKRGQMIEIESVCTDSPNTFWNHLKKLGPKKKSSIPMEVYGKNNEILCDIDSILTTWEEGFKEVYNDGYQNIVNSEWSKEVKTKLGHNESTMLDPSYISSALLNQDITYEEVKNVAMRAKLRKAVGIDMIPNEVLKNDAVINMLVHLFQLCFDTGKIPSVWKRAIIKPIPKGTDKDPRVPSNYRGISLLSCTAKIFTGIINARITKFLENNDGMVEEQNGFRKGRSCNDHIFTLQTIIKMRQEMGHSTFVTFIDFTKAFDRINRDSMLLKLLNPNCKIDGKMYFLIKAFYNLTESCVQVNGNITGWFRTLQGVRQGDNLSPTLFAIYINDLAAGLKELNAGVKIGDDVVSILLYADDIALISPSEEEMQRMLNFVARWCKQWTMDINMSKSKIIHFRKKNVDCSDIKLMLGENELQYVSHYKYLGVYFDEFLDFNYHGNQIAESASGALGAIIAKYKSLGEMGFETYKKCFDTSITPILDYGAEIWGYCKAPMIDAVQNKAIRVYLGVHRFAPNLAINGDVGWIPASIRRKICLVRYWNRVISMQESRLTKRILNTILNTGQTRWLSSVKDIFEEVGVLQNFELKTCCDIPYCRRMLMEKYNEDWNQLLGAKPKLRTYRNIKNKFCPESYTLLNLKRNERSVLAQIRCGILPIHIETGRFVNIKAEDRICTLCNANEVEDEYHFLFYCQLYEFERENFYRELRTSYPNIDQLNNPCKLRFLFNMEPRKLGKYAVRIWDIRQQKLYN